MGQSCAPNYRNDFFSQAYAPWLAQHPEHQQAAVHLVTSLAAHAHKRDQQSAKYDVAIPETLVISLTSRCNRHCSFCRAKKLIEGPAQMLSSQVVESALAQCADLGIGRIALIGGEPFLYPGLEDLLCAYPEFFFTIFTNGTQLDSARTARLSQLANQVLVVNASSEQHSREAQVNDASLIQNLLQLNQGGLFFGFSATVHQHNWQVYHKPETIYHLADAGARFGILFDYLKDFGTTHDPLALTSQQRLQVVDQVRQAARTKNILVICAPEDESIMGGCAAAGNLVLHLSAYATISPCPLVPYSNLAFGPNSLLEALQSDYFKELRKRSAGWEKLGGSCAYRTATDEFQSINKQFGAVCYEREQD